jgi:hypothetical protein
MMARFKADIHGNRGPASRLGTAKSGVRAHIRGWDIGVEIMCTVDSEDNDEISIYRTGGSNGGRKSLIMTLREDLE